MLVVMIVGFLVGIGAAPAMAAPDEEGTATRFARIVIDSLTPTMVTSSSGPTVTVTGQVINTSNRTLSELSIRLERSDAVSTADGLRSSLTIAHPPVTASTAFTRLGVGRLQPGAQASFSLRVPLSGDAGLQISRPGVYPLQINVNGLPDYGGMAQVAGSRTLLPVLSLPPNAARAASYVDPVLTGVDTDPGVGPDGSVSANVSAPSQMTLLWPLAASPQLAPGVLGGNSEPVRLISEDLARSLGTGGRLRSLLTPLDSVVGSSDTDQQGGSSTAPSPPQSTAGGATSDAGTAAPQSAQTSTAAQSSTQTSTEAVAPETAELARSMCLAIDPDLLVTVRAMSLGYVVSTNPADPTSPTVPGTGQADAAAWLSDLRGIASRMCVVALPFAGADPSSLAKINSAGLSAAALDSPADIVDSILGVRSLRGITIPASGVLDAAGAQVLTGAEISRVLTSAGNLETSRPTSGGQYRVGSLAAQSYDEPVTAALAALGSRPQTPAITPADQQVDLDAESPISRRQAALGALAFASINVPESSSTAATDRTEAAALPVTGRSQVVMPSLYWSPTIADADALLSTARVLLGSAAATATSMSEITDALGTAPGSARLAPIAGVGSASQVATPLSEASASAIRDQADLTWRLQGSLVSSADVDTSPERYLAPLREDLLRAITSPSESGTATTTRLSATREATMGAVSTTLGRLRSAVSILDPGGRYTLASERSPLLLVVRNDLALPIRVNITTSAPADLDIGDIGVIEIPARGTRQIQLPTRAEGSEKAITVTITMATVTGVELGAPITLSVHSNAYGKALFIITIVAAAALILLTARRLWHRFRGEPDPADADRPEPDELERLLAATTYQQRRRTLQNEDDQPDPPTEPGATPEPTGIAANTGVDTGPGVDTDTGKDKTGPYETGEEPTNTDRVGE